MLINVMFLLPASTRYVALADCVLVQATCPWSGHRWSGRRHRDSVQIPVHRVRVLAVPATSAAASSSGAVAALAVAASGRAPAAAAVSNAVIATTGSPAAAVATRGRVGRIRLPRFVSMLQFSVMLRFPSRAVVPRLTNS